MSLVHPRKVASRIILDTLQFRREWDPGPRFCGDPVDNEKPKMMSDPRWLPKVEPPPTNETMETRRGGQSLGPLSHEVAKNVFLEAIPIFPLHPRPDIGMTIYYPFKKKPFGAKPEGKLSLVVPLAAQLCVFTEKSAVLHLVLR